MGFMGSALAGAWSVSIFSLLAVFAGDGEKLAHGVSKQKEAAGNILLAASPIFLPG